LISRDAAWIGSIPDCVIVIAADDAMGMRLYPFDNLAWSRAEIDKIAENPELVIGLRKQP
jgi:hypothetical protein